MILEEHILCIWAKMCLRAKCEREARFFGGEEGLLCKSFHLFKILQEGRRKKGRASIAKGFKTLEFSLMMFGSEKP